MNILYLHRTQGGGVEGVHIWGIIDGLTALGHEVNVVSPVGGDRQSDQPAVASEQRPSFKSRLFKVISQYSPSAVFELAEIAYNAIAIANVRSASRGKSYGAIYERYAIFAVAGALYSRIWKVPLIIEVNYTAKTALVRKRSALLMPLAKWVDKLIFCQATTLIAVSSHLKAHLINDYGMSEEKILVVPNAAYPDKFSPDIPAIAEVKGTSLAGKKVVGFVGGFYPWHGLDLLVNAFAKVVENNPETMLLLIGDGPEREKIEVQVERLGLLANVIFAGKVNHAELPHYMSAFTIGVMPDSNDYGSPMKIFEYMSMCKPVVGPDYGPLLDAIEDGKQGLIFNKKDVASLEKCLSKLLSSDELTHQMGVAARQHVVETHNWFNNAKVSLNFALDKQ